MKKVIKKTKKVVKEEPVKEPEVMAPVMEEVVVPKIAKLTVVFPNEDMNQVVGKINEIIEKI